MSAPYGQSLEDLQSEIERRAHVAPDVPPDGFDPTRADPADLEKFGFPPRPDPQLQSAEYELWSNLFLPQLRFVQATFKLNVAFVLRSDFARAAARRTWHQDSPNWSGGYITPRDGRIFTWLYGTWQVPAVNAPAGAPAGHEYRSSTWIGLDGQRRYFHSSLPQIGTAQTAIAGQPPPPPTAWFQWWLRDQLSPIVTLPLPVNTNDWVRCLMIVLSDTQVMFTMLNVNTSTLLIPFFVDSPIFVPMGAPLRVSGATAEWVMERPTDYVTGNLWGLPAYGTVRFPDCLAISATAPLAPGRLENVVGARLIDMFDVGQSPSRAIVISSTDRIGKREITTTYRP